MTYSAYIATSPSSPLGPVRVLLREIRTTGGFSLAPSKPPVLQVYPAIMMKGILVLTLALRLATWPLLGVAAPATTGSSATSQQASATIAGIAMGAGGTPLADHTARARNADTGLIARVTRTNADGEFWLSDLDPGRYLIEVIDGSGRIVATSALISLGAGAIVGGVAITGAPAAGVATTGGVGSFFTSTAGIVLSAAAAMGITAGVVGVGQPRSPSR